MVSKMKIDQMNLSSINCQNSSPKAQNLMVNEGSTIRLPCVVDRLGKKTYMQIDAVHKHTTTIEILLWFYNFS